MQFSAPPFETIQGRLFMRSRFKRDCPEELYAPWVERLVDSLCYFHRRSGTGILYDWDELARRSCIQPERILPGLKIIEKARLIRLRWISQARWDVEHPRRPRVKLLRPKDIGQDEDLLMSRY